MDRKDGQTDQINHNWHDHSEAMCNGWKSDEPDINAQHGTLQNVTGPTTAAWQEFLRTTGCTCRHALNRTPLSFSVDRCQARASSGFPLFSQRSMREA